jgi:hypothetical protein
MNTQPANDALGTSLFGQLSALRAAPSRTRLITDGSLAPQPMPDTLAGLISSFEQTAAQQYADMDVPVAALTMNATGSILVPGRGPCCLTPWAKQQLAWRLGITWGRWFDGIDPQLRADEINRRLARDPGIVRVKTAIGAGDDGESAATLRAFVTPSYFTIPDAMVARAIVEELRGERLTIQRHTTTDRTTSYVARVGAPLHLGGPAQVGDVTGGLIVRNSDVGFSSLTVALHLTRLVCSNGMTVAEDKAILHLAHRHFDPDVLKKALASGLAELPSRLLRAGRALELSAHHGVVDVEAALVAVLRIARLPLRFLAVLVAAYHREPHQSVFGISQAVTLAAQDPTVSAEERVALETASGQYVASFAGR